MRDRVLDTTVAQISRSIYAASCLHASSSRDAKAGEGKGKDFKVLKVSQWNLPQSETVIFGITSLPKCYV